MQNLLLYVKSYGRRQGTPKNWERRAPGRLGQKMWLTPKTRFCLRYVTTPIRRIWSFYILSETIVNYFYF